MMSGIISTTSPTPEGEMLWRVHYASSWYDDAGDHYHNWFLLGIEDAAGRTVTVTITNADVVTPYLIVASTSHEARDSGKPTAEAEERFLELYGKGEAISGSKG